LELQKNIPNLRRLMVDVASSSKQWEEYFSVGFWIDLLSHNIELGNVYL